MDIAVFTPRELPTALGAVRALQPDKDAVCDRFLRAVAKIHGVVMNPDALPTPSLEQTAAVITDPLRRKRLVQLAMVAALLTGASEHAVTQLSHALGLDDSTIRAGRTIGSSVRAPQPTAMWATAAV